VEKEAQAQRCVQKKCIKKKLITAGRKCLLEKVGDEHHVYEL
jgi:hypothetical protein